MKPPLDFPAKTSQYHPPEAPEQCGKVAFSIRRPPFEHVAKRVTWNTRIFAIPDFLLLILELEEAFVEGCYKERVEEVEEVGGSRDGNPDSRDEFTCVKSGGYRLSSKDGRI